MTNGDRIRQMTDEELLAFLIQFDRCIVYQISCTYDYPCIEGVRIWLKQEAKDDE